MSRFPSLRRDCVLWRNRPCVTPLTVCSCGRRRGPARSGAPPGRRRTGRFRARLRARGSRIGRLRGGFSGGCKRTCRRCNARRSRSSLSIVRGSWFQARAVAHTHAHSQGGHAFAASSACMAHVCVYAYMHNMTEVRLRVRVPCWTVSAASRSLLSAAAPIRKSGGRGRSPPGQLPDNNTSGHIIWTHTKQQLSRMASRARPPTPAVSRPLRATQPRKTTANPTPVTVPTPRTLQKQRTEQYRARSYCQRACARAGFNLRHSRARVWIAPDLPI